MSIGADGGNPASSIVGRPFPYGIWLISWGPTYLEGGEFYSSNSDMIRPGGALGVVKVGTGVNGNEVYEIIGDKESLAFMMADLVDWCHATPQWPRKFDPSTSATTGAENIIQYYSVSSFALAYDGYNNSIDFTDSFDHNGPLPFSITTSGFLRCVNETTGVALPIADGPGDPGLTADAIAGIVLGSVAFTA